MRTALCCAVCFWLTLALHASAAEVQWKMHTINAASEFPACAAFDVDHDGDIDLYSGGWWYEAPTWKKHKVRDVPMIRGRYDDYSNQAMDCNGDGWTDIISVNYRSETIYWIEHPGKKLGEQDWAVHVIDKPGPSETGRLHDIDGDGDLDILPNGTTYAAWYEFAPDRSAGVAPAAGGAPDARAPWIPKWIKHDLPPEAAGHGIGWNAERRQLLTPKGIGLPSEKPGDRWRFLPFGPQSTPFHSDASIPILCRKISDNSDLVVWGRGHRTGLYSSRMFQSPKGKRESFDNPWTDAIDSTWSQAHCLVWGDIDGDGEQDLVAGKRFLGHDGKDPGEYDPLALYWYKYDAKNHTWSRHTIHERGPAGFDLDGVVADIDGDGDNDVVAPSRNGLYLFENLRVNKQQAVADATRQPPLSAYKDHSQLMVYATADGDLRPVKTPQEWASRRADILRSMEQVMGPLPTIRADSAGAEGYLGIDFDLQAYEKEQKDFTIFIGELRTEASEASGVKVMFLTPTGLKPGERRPAMLCLQPTGLPLTAMAGFNPKPNRSYAMELAKRGYVCICPAYPTMNEHDFDLKTTDKHFASGTMSAIWDNIRCLDVLESMSNVDPDRIGVIGHSLGGHNGLFTACFDQRIKCVVTSCGFTPFHDYYGGNLKGWTQDRYMPRIRDVYDSNPDKMPFDFYEVLGALAPRGVFINAPLHDDNFEVGGVKKAVAEAQKVYDLLGKSKSLQARYPDCGHDFPEEVREEIYRWLDEQLKK